MSGTEEQTSKPIPAKRLMVFVDDANFGNTAIFFRKQPDYLKLREFLVARANALLLEMVIYIGYPPQWKEETLPAEWRYSRDKKIKRRDFLDFNGFMTVAWYGKEKGETNEKGERLYTANVDVLMAMDVMEYAFEVKPDMVILVTGDQDFAYLAKKLRRKGIRVEVASIEPTISPELKKAVNGFIDLKAFFNTLPESRSSTET
ncbi:MAG: NYN domain-containing protein [Magnetococcales bacterium]|nr:NYN domain-containing protein [Magnetococcales bacterium]NGZ06699.1 NYN domain-containing protein [Magnetococcales bacterium]